MNFRGKSTAGDLSGFLEQGCHFTGELTFEQSFRIDGKVTGTIRSDGDLVVGERGEVDGEIRVGRLFVSGLVRGDVTVTRRLSIHARGRVEGEVSAPALVIDEGGVLEGRCAMQSSGPATAPVLDDSPEATQSAASETKVEGLALATSPGKSAKVVGRFRAS